MPNFSMLFVLKSIIRKRKMESDNVGYYRWKMCG